MIKENLLPGTEGDSFFAEGCLAREKQGWRCEDGGCFVRGERRRRVFDGGVLGGADGSVSGGIGGRFAEGYGDGWSVALLGNGSQGGAFFLRYCGVIGSESPRI